MDIVPIIVAIITALTSIMTSILTLGGVIITTVASGRKLEQELEKKQAITDCKLDLLTKSVNEHNNFAKRMPVVEEQIKVINHRIDDLEKIVNK